jgi:N-acetylmuramoyl-L-alanine amidase
MPSILVETGFISNRADEDYLNSKKGQDEITNNIVKAVKRYKAATESTVNANSAARK